MPPAVVSSRNGMRCVMRLFNCSHCGQRLYFENVVCERCAATLGFLPDWLLLVSLDAAGERRWRPHGKNPEYLMCANYEQHAVCNWMVPSDDGHPLCTACRLNKTIPDLGVEGNIDRWRTLETEKRRLVYSLLRLGLPVVPRSEDAAALAFNFLADTGSPFSERGKVLTGHFAGLITINIKEADSAERERMRGQFDEPYRTLLGHFRHESGHYYWDRLIRDSAWLEECRSLFGDDTLDYGAALEDYYRHGAPANWQEHFISSYATMHPWEDWSETWAHYLHMVDTLETAWQFGIGIRPRGGDDATATVHQDFDPYRAACIDTLVEHWLPLTSALNSLNRSMGHEHAYPFVISPGVIEKLGFVHRVIRKAS
ncbi:MAG: putative zinc-binding peptidase [Pelovirga sp.]